MFSRQAPASIRMCICFSAVVRVHPSAAEHCDAEEVMQLALMSASRLVCVHRLKARSDADEEHDTAGHQ